MLAVGGTTRAFAKKKKKKLWRNVHEFVATVPRKHGSAEVECEQELITKTT